MNYKNNLTKKITIIILFFIVLFVGLVKNSENNNNNNINNINNNEENIKENRTEERSCYTSTEREALMDLYKSTNGNHWRQNKNWGSNESICDWYGIRCTSVSINGTSESRVGSMFVFFLLFI